MGPLKDETGAPIQIVQILLQLLAAASDDDAIVMLIRNAVHVSRLIRRCIQSTERTLSITFNVAIHLFDGITGRMKMQSRT